MSWLVLTCATYAFFAIVACVVIALGHRILTAGKRSRERAASTKLTERLRMGASRLLVAGLCLLAVGCYLLPYTDRNSGLYGMLRQWDRERGGSAHYWAIRLLLACALTYAAVLAAGIERDACAASAAPVRPRNRIVRALGWLYHRTCVL